MDISSPESFLEHLRASGVLNFNSTTEKRTMMPIPHRLSRPGHAPGASVPAKGAARDVLWGRPVFRAPQLNVRPPAEPLPFTTARITAAPREARPAEPAPA